MIQSIDTFCDLNLSGGATLKYAPVNWLDYNSYEPQGLLNGNLQTALLFTQSGGDWLTMPILPGSLDWNQDPQPGEQGSPLSQSINLIIPNVRVEAEPTMEAMAKLRYVIQLLDRNGKNWLIGTPEHGLEFRSNGAIGTATSGLNSYRVQFNGVTAKRAHGYVPVINV